MSILSSCCFYLLQQSRPLRTVHGFTEFKRNHGKSDDLTVIHNVPGTSINLILDSKCLEKYNSGCTDKIQLHPVLGCCEHVLYCPFTCGHKIFFKKAKPGSGQPIDMYPCPFHDGGRAIPDEAS